MPLFQPPDAVLDLPSSTPPKDNFDNLFPGFNDDPDTGFNDDPFSDYSTASDADKINEAATKLSSSGEITDFDSLTNSIDLIEDDGAVFAIDSATGEALSGPLVDLPNPAIAPSVDAFDPTPPGNTIEQRVKISQYPAVGAIQEVEFLNMPTIQEQRDANYKPADIAHHPGEILKYVNTGARSWTITVKLTSRNVEEATRNLNYINVIRSWLMPFYGTGSSDLSLQQYLGAPPPILTLSAYGRQMIGPVPCILLSHSWTFPNDCDYIPTMDSSPFPVILDITLTLKESFSPAEYSSFDLSSYKRGDMAAAFSGGGIYSNRDKKVSYADANAAADEARNQADLAQTEANEGLANMQDRVRAMEAAGRGNGE